LREARYCYLRWGAEAKVKQIDQLYPHLKKEDLDRPTKSTISAPIDVLDLATVIEVSQAASGEMVLEKLIESIMRAAIECAGAERGLLILYRPDELEVVAEATADTSRVTVRLGSAASASFPESLIRFVVCAREDVILDDAVTSNLFSADNYIVQHRARSVICLPLVSRTKLNGVLYLENNLSSHVFNPKRVAVLKVLALQAAMSLENSRLYRDLENREAKIRRLVDADILAIVIWTMEGAIIGSNEAFLRLVQFNHEEIAAGLIRWTDLTPPEWHDVDERAIATIKQAGRVEPFEKELFRKDGSRVSVLVAAALFEEGGAEGVAFALDLTEQKRVEAALRRSESYLEQAQRLAQVGSWAWQVPNRRASYMSAEWYRTI
jgi:PAS domain S-box-containing protein